MARQIDYDRARDLLEAQFSLAEEDFRDGISIGVPQDLESSVQTLFTSKTQAYREALVGCCLARLLDDQIDITKPYVNQGDHAYNGRTLDERVVNPFLHEHEIPCSKSPFLSALRRNVDFTPDTAKGLRDKVAFEAMLSFIAALKAASDAEALAYLRFLLGAFVRLRDQSKIALSRINRVSIEQYAELIQAMLGTQSGGRLPVLLAVATFEAIKRTYDLPWRIEFQGINVADSQNDAGGDITVFREGAVVLSVEVTERAIDKARLRSTFNTKIAPNGIDDYLFFFSAAQPTEEARAAARSYFAQGHEINFAPVSEWILTVLTTLGAKGRTIFTETFIDLLDARDVPAALKVTWNNNVRQLFS